MIRKLFTGLLLAISVLALSQAAHAGAPTSTTTTTVYGIEQCNFLFQVASIPAGPNASVTIDGERFTPAVTFTFFINGQVLGTATADGAGNILATFPLPAEFQGDGTYDITVTCPSGQVATNVIIVGTGVTPTTLTPAGATSTTLDLAKAGAVLVGVGGLFLLVAQRRRQTAAA